MRAPVSCSMGCLAYRQRLPALLAEARQKPATGCHRSSNWKQSTRGTGPASIAPAAAATASWLGTIAYMAMLCRAMSKYKGSYSRYGMRPTFMVIVASHVYDFDNRPPQSHKA